MNSKKMSNCRYVCCLRIIFIILSFHLQLLEGDNVESYARHQGDLTHYTSRLYLINAKDSDAGKYQCIISNEFGSAYSKRSNVNVYGKYLPTASNDEINFFKIFICTFSD